MSELNPIGTAPSPSAPGAPLKKVAQQFEAIFVRQMIGAMRQAKLTDDPLDSSATDNFQELADARTADSIAAHGHLGLAEMIERQLATRSGEAK
jgi:flagellar protein FlgJ